MDKRNAFAVLYKVFLKQIFFQFDPETVHDTMVKTGIFLGHYKPTRNLVRWSFAYKNDMLIQNIQGILFTNPIGLSAGFDKNAELIDILPSVGFGFMEVGSITGETCAGNSKPRLWRLKKSKSLLVYYGLKNDGCKQIALRLQGKQSAIPLGISVAKTNSKETVDTTDGIADYIKVYNTFAQIGDYYTINISCPNTYGGEPFTNPDKLDALLTEIDLYPHTKPIFLKISPDLSLDAIDSLLNICDHHQVQGFICSNLTKNRANPKLFNHQLPEKGGMSGKVVEDLSNDLIAYIYKKTNHRYVLIGVGGVFTAEDAYKKITLGANLVQIITGMIFEGPQVIGQVNKELVSILKKDGFSNIEEAVGSKA